MSSLTLSSTIVYHDNNFYDHNDYNSKENKNVNSNNKNTTKTTSSFYIAYFMSIQSLAQFSNEFSYTILIFLYYYCIIYY